MTPRALAEKIGLMIGLSGESDLLDRIESLLSSALEEAIAESRKSAAFIKQTVCAKLINEAKAAAYERCAKLMEDHGCTDCVDRIRQLKDHLK